MDMNYIGQTCWLKLDLTVSLWDTVLNLQYKFEGSLRDMLGERLWGVNMEPSLRTFWARSLPHDNVLGAP